MAKRIKNTWKKNNETTRGARWENKTNPKSKARSCYIIPINSKGEYIGTISKQFIPKGQFFTRNKIAKWEFGVNSYSTRLLSKKFKTKKEAKAYALKWMQKNQ